MSTAPQSVRIDTLPGRQVFRVSWTWGDDHPRPEEKGMPPVVLEQDWSPVGLEEGMAAIAALGLRLGELETHAPDSDGLRRVVQKFSIADDSVALYGLGQFDDGKVNWRGASCHIVQRYIGSPCPLLVSTGGWAVLWTAPCESRFEDGPAGMSFSAEAVRRLEFFVIAGATIDDQIARYRDLTGTAPLMPRYFHGFWQFYNRYKTFDEIHEVVREYRSRGLPLDAVVQDWKYWKDEIDIHWNSLELEPSRFPDPAANIAKIHAAKVKFMMTLWPAFGTATKNERLMRERGFLLEGIDLCSGAARVYDAFNPDARDFYWEIVRGKMLDIGVDSLWMDGTEPDCGSSGAGADAPYHVKFSHCAGTHAGPVREVLNAYPLATTEGVYQHWRAEREDRCCILTRASFAGIQRNAAAVWSGDTHCRWEDFRRQVPMGIGLSMAGIPYWSHDIGGWLWEKDLYPEGSSDPAFAELHTRWFQLGVFTPMCRIHGSWTPREIHRFPQPFQDVHADFLRLRSRLLPYLYSLSWRVTSEGYTPMRGLAMDFPGDPRAREVSDQFLLGPAFLVRPVTEPMLYPAPEYGSEAAQRLNTDGHVPVYLPAGVEWVDFWTGESHAGGQTLRVHAPIERMPLFVRAGSIVPLGPVKDYSDQPARPEDMEIRVYPGRDAAFTLYDDDGWSTRYEQGDFQTRPLRWDNTTRQLHGAEGTGWTIRIIEKN